MTAPDRPTARPTVLLAVLVGLGLVPLAGRLCWVMVVHPARYQEAVFRPAPLLDEVDALVAAGTLAARDGEVVLDAEAFARSHPDERGFGVFRRRVARLVPSMRVDERAVVLPPHTVSVIDPRRLGGARGVPRGWILDRAGEPLAATVAGSRRGAWRRVQLHGASTGNLVGFQHPVYGTHGLERTLEPLVSGARPRPFAERLRRLLERRPIAGDDVYLTLDLAVQTRAVELLGDRPGAAVVLAVADGAILAAASSPGFDPETADREAWERAAHDTVRRPLAQRAFDVRYPPGSTFKLIDAAAWLSAEGADPDLTVACDGRHPVLGVGEHLDHGRRQAHGTVGLDRALATSCNVFFADLGVRLGPRLTTMAERFGFNAPLTVDGHGPGVPFEAAASVAMARIAYDEVEDVVSGRARTVERIAPLTDLRHNPKLVAQAAIGQNLVMATPLEMAVVTATIAGGGERLEPYLVAAVTPGRGIADPALATDGEPDPGPSRARAAPRDGPPRRPTGRSRHVVTRALEPPVAADLARRLAAVVEHGTGRELDRLWRTPAGFFVAAPRPGPGDPAPGVLVRYAGKTGTAQVTGARDHAWFVGFAPLERPRVAVAVIVEHAGYGSRHAGPIATELLAAGLTSLGATTSAPAAVAARPPP